MDRDSEAVLAVFMRLFWTLVASLVPAVMLGRDFGLSVGVGYFVVAGALLSIHYDTQDTLKAVRKLTARDRFDSVPPEGLPHPSAYGSWSGKG